MSGILFFIFASCELLRQKVSDTIMGAHKGDGGGSFGNIYYIKCIEFQIQ